MSEHRFEAASAVVIFCCGPHCPQEAIAGELERNGVAVVTVPESGDAFRLDAEQAAQRILEIHAALSPGMPVGYAGASVAGAGALIAAALRPDSVAAVVSINGRTDLATDHLRGVRAPALLVVNDLPVLRMNREAVAVLRAERRLEIVRGEDSDAVDHIVRKSARWLVDRLAGVPAA
ncbi:MAG TPA: hypothetical protein VNA04_01130 [Thermoanaerobaculia bacterium]|nr:hypothetical protein [Thermoanaerobaculia bacterium]